MSVNSERFDIKKLHDIFNSALFSSEDVDLKLYLDSYMELNKFFLIMGSIFSFVSDDLVAKINRLKELLLKDAQNFKSVSSMINYEKDNGMLFKKSYESGSRTLLRLHRGLDFMRLFLKYVSVLKDDEGTGSVCYSAYDKTLCNHHSFLIRTGAKLAMYSMPTKGNLLQRVCGDDPEFLKLSLEFLPTTLGVIDVVFERIDKMYTDHNLHSLP